MPGAILVVNRGVPHRNRFTPCWHNFLIHPSIYGSSPRTLQTSFALPPLLPSSITINTIMAAFNSTIAIAADQLATAPQLEPAFEHLLRNSTVHESVIGVLRINAITDRDTFVNMFDSEAALKDGASDLGFDLSQVACRTSASSRASSRLGKPQKLCLRLSSRQTLLLEPTVFLSRCSRVIGLRSSRNSRTNSGSIFQTTSFLLNLCSRTSRSALQMVPSRQNLYPTW